MSSTSGSSSGVMVAQSLPPELSRVAKLVDSKPEALARGDMGMHTAALAAAQLIYKISLETEKSAITPISKLLAGLSPESAAPTTRAQKRKRDELPKTPPLAFRPTPKIGRNVDGLGMNASKLWAMMEHRTGPLCGILEAVVAPDNIIEEEEEEDEDEEDEDDEDESEGDEEAEFELGDEDEDMSGLSDEEEEEEEDESDDGESYLGDSTMELSRAEDYSDLDSDDAEEASDDEETNHAHLHNLDLDRAQNPQKAAKRRAHPTLDDTFFSIDEFNRETEELEAQNRSSGALKEDDEDDEEEVDLFTGVHDIEDTPEEANDPKYQDFFAPPPKSKSKKVPEKSRRKVKLLVASPPGPKRSVKVRFNEEVKVRNIKSKRTRASLLAELMEAEGEEGGEEEEEEEGEEGEGPWASEMLEDEEMGSDDDDEMGSDGGSDAEPGKADLFADDAEEDEDEAGLSTHQKRLAALSEEIQALEAENVAPKPWTMQGEATSRSRPQNALLEADLEFEHVGKVVPIVTEESVKNLEERIKARIIEGRYDDVVRKRDVEAKPFLPSRMFELKDTQSEKSLAQIYEDEYTAAASGSKVVDDRDGKLAESHKEITELWDGICYKLDALSNAHFTPKQPQAKIETVTNMASASLESALPTSLSTSTLLAPEEVYTPSSLEIRARSELTPSEKKAARGREKKKRRKDRDVLSSAVDNSSTGGRQPKNVKEAKEHALNGLVKSGKGVTIVGKPGKSAGKNDAASKAQGVEQERDGKRFKL